MDIPRLFTIQDIAKHKSSQRREALLIGKFQTFPQWKIPLKSLLIGSSFYESTAVTSFNKLILGEYELHYHLPSFQNSQSIIRLIATSEKGVGWRGGLPLWRTRVPFPATTLGDSQPPATPAPGDLSLSSGLHKHCTDMCTSPHADMTHRHNLKSKWNLCRNIFKRTKSYRK